VTKPKEKQRRKISTKEGAGFMFLKLNHLESYYHTLLKYELGMTEKPIYCTLDEF